MRCGWCHLNRPPIDGIRAPFLMRGVLRELIYRFKYRNLGAVTPVLGQLLDDNLSSHPMPGQMIVPVPLHRTRLNSQGYNQATPLAQELSYPTCLVTVACWPVARIPFRKCRLAADNNGQVISWANLSVIRVPAGWKRC